MGDLDAVALMARPGWVERDAARLREEFARGEITERELEDGLDDAFGVDGGIGHARGCMIDLPSGTCTCGGLEAGLAPAPEPRPLEGPERPLRYVLRCLGRGHRWQPSHRWDGQEWCARCRARRTVVPDPDAEGRDPMAWTPLAGLLALAQLAGLLCLGVGLGTLRPVLLVAGAAGVGLPAVAGSR